MNENLPNVPKTYPITLFPFFFCSWQKWQWDRKCSTVPGLVEYEEVLYWMRMTRTSRLCVCTRLGRIVFLPWNEEFYWYTIDNVHIVIPKQTSVTGRHKQVDPVIWECITEKTSFKYNIQCFSPLCSNNATHMLPNIRKRKYMNKRFEQNYNKIRHSLLFCHIKVSF